MKEYSLPTYEFHGQLFSENLPYLTHVVLTPLNTRGFVVEAKPQRKSRRRARPG
jgi:hypothetical protein